MEAAGEANNAIQAKYSKDKKVGEGTYAVVYLGQSRPRPTAQYTADNED
jgi:hypothetical protein